MIEAAATKTKRHHIASVMGLLVWLSSGVSFAAEPDRKPPLRILFVGNSYLYVNDLPSQVRRMAATEGVVLDVTMRASPDFALSDHLHTRQFQSDLDQRWDWIVLQQGPSSLTESRDELIASVRAVVARVQGRPTRIALMSGWPAKQYVASSVQGEASYRLAATDVGACVMPVATAWRLARESKKPPTLYAQDRLHATRTGTQLAAMVVLRGLLGGDPKPASEDRSGNASKRAAALEQVVFRAFELEPRGCALD